MLFSLVSEREGSNGTAFGEMNSNIQGYARKRSIAISPLAFMPHKTTFHELAHVCLGHTQEADFSCPCGNAASERSEHVLSCGGQSLILKFTYFGSPA